jgi:hypothetical protein
MRAYPANYDPLLASRLLEASSFAYRISDATITEPKVLFDKSPKAVFTDAQIPAPLRAVAKEAYGFEVDDLSFTILKRDDHVIISFRGSIINDKVKYSNWQRNFNYSLQRTSKVMDSTSRTFVHVGFKKAVGELWPTLIAAFNDIIVDYTKKGVVPKIFWTGHSLGAALATLALARVITAANLTKAPIKYIGGVIPASTSPKDWNVGIQTACRFIAAHTQALYTYASPKCGDESLQRFYDKHLSGKVFRIHSSDDPVPKLTPLPGYVHVGESVPLTDIYAHLAMNYRMLLRSELSADQLALLEGAAITASAATEVLPSEISAASTVHATDVSQNGGSASSAGTGLGHAQVVTPVYSASTGGGAMPVTPAKLPAHSELAPEKV